MVQVFFQDADHKFNDIQILRHLQQLMQFKEEKPGTGEEVGENKVWVLFLSN